MEPLVPNQAAKKHTKVELKIKLLPNDSTPVHSSSMPSSPSQQTVEEQCAALAEHIACCISSATSEEAFIKREDLNLFFGKCSSSYESGCAEASSLIERLSSTKEDGLPREIFQSYLNRKLQKMPSDMYRSTLKSMANDIAATRESTARDSRALKKGEISVPDAPRTPMVSIPPTVKPKVRSSTTTRRRGENWTPPTNRNGSELQETAASDIEEEGSQESKQRRRSVVEKFQNELKKSLKVSDNTCTISEESAKIQRKKAPDRVSPNPKPSTVFHNFEEVDEHTGKSKYILRSKYVKKMKSVKKKYLEDYDKKCVSMETKFKEEIQSLKTVVMNSGQFCEEIGNKLKGERAAHLAKTKVLNNKLQKAEEFVKDFTTMETESKTTLKALQARLEKAEQEKRAMEEEMIKINNRHQDEVSSLKKLVEEKDEQMQVNLKHHQNMLRVSLRAAKVKYQQDLKRALTRSSGIALPSLGKSSPRTTKKQKESSQVQSS